MKRPRPGMSWAEHRQAAARLEQLRRELDAIAGWASSIYGWSEAALRANDSVESLRALERALYEQLWRDRPFWSPAERQSFQRLMRNAVAPGVAEIASSQAPDAASGEAGGAEGHGGAPRARRERIPSGYEARDHYWRLGVQRLPELLDLEREIRLVTGDEPTYCAEAEWMGRDGRPSRLDQTLQLLTTGRSRATTEAEVVLWERIGYAVVDRLYSLLPTCRRCACGAAATDHSRALWTAYARPANQSMRHTTRLGSAEHPPASRADDVGGDGSRPDDSIVRRLLADLPSL